MFRPVIFLVVFAIPALARERPVDFNRDVRPILSDNCFPCHGPDAESLKANLRLDLPESATKRDAGGWAAIVPGNLERSLLVELVESEDPDERMPPPESHRVLDDEEKDTLRRWVAEGAPYERHWAYEPPRWHAVPDVADDTWPLGWIDRFLLAGLESEEVAPAPPADRATLLRRLSFDLTGLPPTLDELDAFLAGDDPRAYERAVDRLLASPRHAERLAVYWLDLVRYADTVGYHGDQGHHASPYRDYVIDALRRNLPFDAFTREQLAGDLIATRDAGQLSEDEIADLRTASAYNRLVQTSHEGGVQVKEYLAMYQADRIRNVAAVWLGGTLGCAECHDHKYDPYTAKDFYAMGAIFADVEDERTFKGGNHLVTARAPEIDVLTALDRERIAELVSRIERASDDERAALEAEKAGIAPRRVMVTVSVEPRPIRLLPRGNWLDDSGPIVEPAVPEFLGRIEGEGRVDRLDLANWLVAPVAEGGIGELTARVLVNRLWSLFFGAGLSRSLDDLGGQGEPPDHPELLDNLALELVENEWDVRHVIRLIVLSRAYRMSSQVSNDLAARDPENRLLARQARFRLPAEMVRDNALSTSGLLVHQLGGASVRPYQPAGHYRHLNFPQRRYQADRDERQWRRGLYVHWQRQFLHPMLQAFDAPRREICVAERSTSNTPTAALVLLNDPTFVEAARAFAARVLGEGPRGEDDARLRWAFRTATSRSPSPAELDVLAQLLAKHRAELRDDPASAEALLGVGIAPTPEGVEPTELAAWTSVARTLLCLSETLTRN